MGRIIVCENAFEAPTANRHFEWEGPLVDWLVVHYPHGFESAISVISFNGLVLAVDDYDKPLGQNDVVAIALTPAGEALVGYLINALIAVAVGLVINYLFGPKPVKPNSGQAASPTYSFGSAQNEARLGEPIPVVYGEVILVPLYAAQPYVYYKDNSQYLVVLFALSRGDCIVDEVLVADSRVADMPDGTVRYEAYKPSQHLATLGTIGTDFGIHENVVTPVEVQDVDLQRSSDTIYNIMEFVAPNQLVNQDKFPDSFAVGKVIRIEGSRSNDGNYTITARSAPGGTLTLSPNVVVEADFFRTVNCSFEIIGGFQAKFVFTTLGLPADIKPGMRCDFISPHIVIKFITGIVESLVYKGASGFTEMVVRLDFVYTSGLTAPAANRDFNFSSGPFSVSVGTYDNGYRGWYAISKPGTKVDKIEVDLAWPNGLANTQDDGKVVPMSVTWLVEYQLIDDSGNVLGASTSTLESFYASTITPQRRTFSYTVPLGRYRIRLKRQTIQDFKRTTQSAIIWNGVKGFIPYSEITTSVYGDVTILAIEAKATSGLSSSAQTRFRARVRREIPTIASSFATKAFTTNPADIFCDILREPLYGGGRTDADLDLVTIVEARDAWTGTNGFNAVFDTRTTVFDALGACLGPNRGRLTAYDRKFGILRERPQNLSKYLFAPTAMLADSFNTTYKLVEDYEYDGVRVAYRDPLDFVERYALYPPSVLNPKSISLFGCTDYAVAYGTAKYLWLQSQSLRSSVQFSTELDGMLPDLGDRIAVSHPCVDWGTSTRVTSVETLVDGYGLTLESPILYPVSNSLWVYLRNRVGGVLGPIAGTRHGNGYGIKVTELPSYLPDLAVAQDEGMTIAYGYADTFAKHYIVNDISSQDSRRLSINGTRYDGDLYIDTIPLPEWS